MVQVLQEGERGVGDGPLVTYRLQCYRHEAFVAEAVRSVLAQTYRPLEILITDDASPDRTFEIAQQIARDYRGPHRVVLHRSERNREILEHCNEALHLVQGEFFVWMSGDDVAEPEQTERLVAAWRQEGASGVWSNSRIIDQHGNDDGPLLPAGHPYTLDLCDYADGRFLDFPYSGACGYPREVIDRFGPLPAHLGTRGLEHHFGFRAALLGRKHYLPQALMRRRRHPGRATAGESFADRQSDLMIAHERQIRVRLQVLVNCRDALAALEGTVRDPADTTIAKSLSRQIANEVRRLLEFEAFRARASRAGGAPPEHSGWHYPPNSLTFVREVPDQASNLLAAECKYFSVPWSVGGVEPCGLRNHTYPGVLSAWTEAELMLALKEQSVPRKR
jgi:glycosyltransferase involved in cell wall biosynthesis